MKNLSSHTALTLDDLLGLASSFDDGHLVLDAYEVHELIGRLLHEADERLGTDSELRLGGTRVHKDSSGITSVRLKNSGLALQLCEPHGRELVGSPPEPVHQHAA